MMIIELQSDCGTCYHNVEQRWEVTGSGWKRSICRNWRLGSELGTKLPDPKAAQTGKMVGHITTICVHIRREKFSDDELRISIVHWPAYKAETLKLNINLRTPL